MGTAKVVPSGPSRQAGPMPPGARFVTSCTVNCAPAGTAPGGTSTKRKPSGEASDAARRGQPARSVGSPMGVPGSPGLREARPAAAASPRRPDFEGPQPASDRGGQEGDEERADEARPHHLLSRMTAQTLMGRMPSGLHSWIAVQTALQSKSFTVQLRRVARTVQEA